MKTGWQTASFEDAIEHVTYTAKVQRKDFLEEGEYPVISQEESFLNGYWNNAGDLFKVDRPVVLFGDHTRVLKFIGFDFVLGADGVKILKPKTFLDPKFFYYQLLGADIRHLGYARHYRILKELRINYPSIKEQQRIVTILDEVFEGIATAKDNAEKNHQNAREVFVNELRSVFTQGGDKWVARSLAQTCEMYQPKTISSKDLIPDGPYPVFGANGIIGRYDKFNHEVPQLLITCRGATCGAVNVSEPYSWITGNAMVVRPKDRSLDLRFLEYIFRGGIDISPAITGAAQPQITRTNLSPLEICFPRDVSEQERLVIRFDQLTEETQHLIDSYQQKTDLLNELKQSVLHRAFNGDL